MKPENRHAAEAPGERREVAKQNRNLALALAMIGAMMLVLSITAVLAVRFYG